MSMLLELDPREWLLNWASPLEARDRFCYKAYWLRYFWSGDIRMLPFWLIPKG